MEIVPGHTYKNGTKCGAHLSYISGPQSLSQLSLQGGNDDAFFLVAVPVETQIKNGSNTISNYGKDYAVLYEQVFGSCRYGLLKTVGFTMMEDVENVKKNRTFKLRV